MIRLLRSSASITLRWLQFAALLAIAIIVPTSYRNIWWLNPLPVLQIYAEFRGVVTFLVHYALICLAVATLLRLLIDRGYWRNIRLVLRANALSYGMIIWAILMAWMALGLFWADSQTLVLYQLVHWLAVFGMAVVTAELVWENSWQEYGLLAGLSFAALLYALVAITQVIKGTAVGLGAVGELVWPADNLFNFGSGQLFRGYALAVHPNNLAGYLMIALFGLVMLMYHWQRYQQRGWVLTPILVVIGAGFLATLSRTAIVACALTLPIALFKAVSLLRIRLRWSALLIVPTLIGMGFALLMFTDIGDNLISRFQRLSDNPNRIVGRVFYEFDDTTPVIQDYHPIGTGAGNLMTVIGHRRAGYERLLLPAHNAYWVTWAELGLPGLTLYMVACASVVFRIRLANNVGVVIWGSAFLAICLTGLFDYYFLGDLRSHTLMFWLLGMWWGYAMVQEEYTPV